MYGRFFVLAVLVGCSGSDTAPPSVETTSSFQSSPDDSAEDEATSSVSEEAGGEESSSVAEAETVDVSDSGTGEESGESAEAGEGVKRAGQPCEKNEECESQVCILVIDELEGPDGRVCASGCLVYRYDLTCDDNSDCCEGYECDYLTDNYGNGSGYRNCFDPSDPPELD